MFFFILNIGMKVPLNHWRYQIYLQISTIHAVGIHSKELLWSDAGVHFRGKSCTGHCTATATATTLLYTSTATSLYIIVHIHCNIIVHHCTLRDSITTNISPLLPTMGRTSSCGCWNKPQITRYCLILILRWCNRPIVN